MIPYTSKAGARRFKPEVGVDVDRDELESGITGWCLACGTTQHGVEPDARQYRCQSCTRDTVYGLEELALMGLLAFGEEGDE